MTRSAFLNADQFLARAKQLVQETERTTKKVDLPDKIAPESVTFWEQQVYANASFLNPLLRELPMGQKRTLSDGIAALKIPKAHLSGLKRFASLRTDEIKKNHMSGAYDGGVIFLDPSLCGSELVRVATHECGHHAFSRGLAIRGVDLSESFKNAKRSWRRPSEEHFRENLDEFFARIYETAFLQKKEDADFFCDLLEIPRLSPKIFIWKKVDDDD